MLLGNNCELHNMRPKYDMVIYLTVCHSAIKTNFKVDGP